MKSETATTTVLSPPENPPEADSPRPHVAKFSDSVILAVQPWLDAEMKMRFEDGVGHLTILDCFAGIGRVHELHDQHGDDTWGIELEPEWATQHPRTVVGNSLHPPFRDQAFDVLFTSPCLEQSERVLTSDLRWVPVGDVEVGDELMAFDENGNGQRHGGRVSRRRWQRAVVVRSEAKRVACVRVILANGDEIVTTPEHPWLAHRCAKGSPAEWVVSKDLMGSPGNRRGPWFVSQQTETWNQRSSFDAGWLSGMFDGEGSLSLGAHGSPKMTLCQVDGPVIDRAEKLMAQFGYEPNKIPRIGVPEHRQKISNLYVTGGFPGLMKALGELRPTRLLSKWETFDLSTRTVEAEKVAVIAVEPAGFRDIQEIETSTGTYIGEGYLMHNCYGNRMADTYDGRDGSKRMTYRLSLGRMPSPDSAAVIQWGPKYREFHTRVMVAVLPKLAPGALVVINMSNHVRGDIEMHVVEWWVQMLTGLGLRLLAVEPVGTPRFGYGSNHDARADTEFLLVFRVPSDEETAAAALTLAAPGQMVLL